MPRLLLSYNHAIADHIAPNLSADEFCDVFITALKNKPGWQVSAIAHPHWRCEIKTEESPETIGQILVQTLVTHRQQQLPKPLEYTILALGGRKTSPTQSDHPHALNLGEWGVDLVETEDVDAFLTSINWEALAAARPPDGVFKMMS